MKHHEDLQTEYQSTVAEAFRLAQSIGTIDAWAAYEAAKEVAAKEYQRKASKRAGG